MKAIKNFEKWLQKDFFSHLPGFVTLEKIQEEFFEHLEMVRWVLLRVVLPLAILYFLVNGFFSGRFLLSNSIFGVVVFLYSAFLVDLDAFFNPRGKSQEATPFERLIILFFAPIIIYYTLSQRIVPRSLPPKYFHSKKRMITFTLFVFLIGLLLFFSVLDALFLALFGLLGYATHLGTDKLLW